MNKEEIIEFNKRCAEFLNISTDLNNPSNNHWIESYALSLYEKYKDTTTPKEYLECFDFHNNWNAIFEVIEKMKSLKETKGNAIGKTCMITKFDISNYGITIGFENGDYYGSICIGHTDNGRYMKMENDCDNDKEATVQAINKFLIWYKENV